MNCQYQRPDGLCSAPIMHDSHSYSGYSHIHNADWCHWATDIIYGPQSINMDKILKLCKVCGKSGPGNEDHTQFSGHQFVTNL